MQQSQATIKVTVARFTPGGMPDAEFGSAGRVLLADTHASDLSLDRLGRVVLAATSASGTGAVRLRRNGALDSGFARDGFAEVPIAAWGAFATAIAVDEENQPVVAVTGPTGSVVVGRFSSGGEPDESFGVDGRRVIAFRLADVAFATSVSASANGQIRALITPFGRDGVPSVVTLQSDGRRSSQPGNLDVSTVGAVRPPLVTTAMLTRESSILLAGVGRTGPSFQGFLARYVTSSSDPQPPSLGVRRIGGTDRVETAVLASQDAFPNRADGATPALGVVVASAADWPDAITASPLAVDRHGPLLLTSPSTLEERVLREIDRLIDPGMKVEIVGGPVAVSTSVDEALVRAGYVVERIAGSDRFDTARLVASLVRDRGTAILVNAWGFADALPAAAAARSVGAPILLTDGANANPATTNYLAGRRPVKVFAVGGPAAHAVPQAHAVAGEDRYATSAAVARTFFPTPALIGIANGESFADGLTGGWYSATEPGPLLLSRPGELPASVGEYLESQRGFVERVLGFGGVNALAEDVLAAAADAAA